MKIWWVIVAIFLICGHAVADDWQVVKGEHFLIYYMDDKAFARETLTYAERYYDKIAHDLGYSRYDKFWHWEDRVKIYIYPTHNDFLKATGMPEWVFGTAFYEEKAIVTHRWNEGFLHSLLPHELTHLIFRDFVGFKGEVPLWLDEGVAQWEEKDRKRWALDITRQLVKEKDYIPIAELMRIDTKDERNFELSRKFYAQAISLINYLIEEYGGTRFSLFCRQLRDGKSMDEALSFVYTSSIRNIDELEKKWAAYYAGG